ncbi:MAG: hypothetical protein IT190_01200 [Microbacteriaceae bacterium]|nr:hypothetical protein [Microbacteriaceae bacterium]
MRARLAASAILVALLAVGTTGCTFMTDQATTNKYDPSDGIGTSLGNITVNNALLVTEDGENASLVISLHNASDFGVRVSIQYEDAAQSKVNDSIYVNSQSVVSLGAAGPSSVTLHGIDAPAGSLFPVFLQYGDVTGEQLWLPVLTPTGPYAGLAPAPAP